MLKWWLLMKSEQETGQSQLQKIHRGFPQKALNWNKQKDPRNCLLRLIIKFDAYMFEKLKAVGLDASMPFSFLLLFFFWKKNNHFCLSKISWCLSSNYPFLISCTLSGMFWKHGTMTLAPWHFNKLFCRPRYQQMHASRVQSREEGVFHLHVPLMTRLLFRHSGEGGTIGEVQEWKGS